MLSNLEYLNHTLNRADIRVEDLKLRTSTRQHQSKIPKILVSNVEIRDSKLRILMRRFESKFGELSFEPKLRKMKMLPDFWKSSIPLILNYLLNIKKI